MEKNDEKLSFYLHHSFSILPFVIFIAFVIYFSISKAFSLTGMIAFGVVGLIIGSLFSKSQTKYWNAAMSGITDPSTGILVTIFLVVGVFSQIMARGNVAGGFVWLGNSIGMTGSLFCGFTFLSSALFGLATGTSVGTIVTLTPVLYPAGFF
jgi:Na+/H+ antiporter NhaC